MTEPLSGVVQVPRRCPVSSGAEMGLLSLMLSISQSSSIGDFLLTLACPIKKETLWEGFLYLTLGSETVKGVANNKVFDRTGD